MKIELDNQHTNTFHIESYDNDKIVVNNTTMVDPFVLLLDRVIPNWRPIKPVDLTFDDLQAMIDCHPELIIIGTGKALQFPTNEIISKVQQLNIGIEVMDTGAACRCYNLVISEGRSVAAAFFL